MTATATAMPFMQWRQVSRVTDVGGGRYQAHKMDFVGEFHKQVIRWRSETFFFSLVKDRVEHPAFQKIVSMGQKVVPLIVSELREQPDFLFLALHAITGENPVTPQSQGRPDDIINAWLIWAERNQQNAA